MNLLLLVTAFMASLTGLLTGERGGAAAVASAVSSDAAVAAVAPAAARTSATRPEPEPFGVPRASAGAAIMLPVPAILALFGRRLI